MIHARIALTREQDRQNPSQRPLHKGGWKDGLIPHHSSCEGQGRQADSLRVPSLPRRGHGRYPACAPSRRPRTTRGFTLIELLVVILIILIISAVALPVILPAYSHRQVSEAARIVQGAFIGAHDNAIHNNQSSGIRLLPDPIFNGLNPSGLLDRTQILAANRIIPLDPAPEYSEGYVSVSNPNSSHFVPQTGSPTPLAYPGEGGGTYPLNNLFMIEESFYVPGTCPPQPNPPTSWFWNIRVGDKIQINHAGPWYTVVGPMAVGPAAGNSEMFVNVGPPGVNSPLIRIYNSGNCQTTYQPDFLFLVNGQDDNNNGWVDEGWDGVDNNGNGMIDENVVINNVLVSEWEPEGPLGALNPSLNASITNQPYTIQRRPAPSPNAREVALPTNVVIDLTTWGYPLNSPSLERSRVPAGAFNHFTGYVDIIVNPDGTVVPTTIYSTPSSAGLSSAFMHLWLAERSDVVAPNLNAKMAPYLPLPSSLTGESAAAQTFLQNQFNGGAIKGEYRVVTIFNRTGQTTTVDSMPFDLTNLGTANYNTSLPFLGAQQGISGGP